MYASHKTSHRHNTKCTSTKCRSFTIYVSIPSHAKACYIPKSPRLLIPQHSTCIWLICQQCRWMRLCNDGGALQEPPYCMGLITASGLQPQVPYYCSNASALRQLLWRIQIKSWRAASTGVVLGLPNRQDPCLREYQQGGLVSHSNCTRPCLLANLSR